MKDFSTYVTSPVFQDVMLEKMRMEFRKRCSPRDVTGTELEFKSYVDQITGHMVLHLRASIWAERPNGQEQVISYPATWWDAFKERWLVRWFKGLKVEKVRHIIEPYILYPGLRASIPDKYYVMKVAVRTELPPIFVDNEYAV